MAIDEARTFQGGIGGGEIGTTQQNIHILGVANRRLSTLATQEATALPPTTA